MSCYGDEIGFYSYDAAKQHCESNLHCKAVKHLGCGNADDNKPYLTCGQGSTIGVRIENENLATDDKQNCIYKKLTAGIS